MLVETTNPTFRLGLARYRKTKHGLVMTFAEVKTCSNSFLVRKISDFNNLERLFVFTTINLLNTRNLVVGCEYKSVRKKSLYTRYSLLATNQTVNLFRPLARRRFNTFRPQCDFIRARKPWVRFLLITDG